MEKTSVGKYALIKEIGRGGMADVWIGKVCGASGFEKLVAVKLLAPDMVDQEEYQRALTDEAKLQVSLKHPNIVDVYDLNFEAENPYLVMEYVEGIEFRRLLKILRDKAKKLPLTIAAYIVSEVSKALSHAHGRRHPQTGKPLQIVHRDISSSNILVSVHGDVKLTDFGIAKSSIQSGKTQVGQIKGKFRYMSPEQAQGATIDHRSDIYSLGLVFYECLVGNPAYEGPTDARVLEMARTGEVAFPTDLDPDLKRILSKMLAKKADDRYAELADFRRELTDCLRKGGELCDREGFGQYLEGLNLPELRRAALDRQEAERWNPLPSSRILEQTGQISVVGTMALPMRKNRRLWVGLAAFFIGLAVLFVWFLRREEPRKASTTQPAAGPPHETMTFGTLQIETEPAEALVTVRFADKSLSRPSPVVVNEVPLQQPVDITVSRKGFKTVQKRISLDTGESQKNLKILLLEARDLQVVFNAVPYALVSIPGHFSGLETPTEAKRLPPGEYQVTFMHGPSGRQASARLRGGDGGPFVCFANLSPDDPSAESTASCRPR